MRDSCGTSEKSKGKGKGSATQRTGKGKRRATQPAVKGKSFATGGKTKTGKEATLPLFLSPNKDLVRKGKHSRFARHLQRVAGSKVLAELIIFIVLWRYSSCGKLSAVVLILRKRAATKFRGRFKGSSR